MREKPTTTRQKGSKNLVKKDGHIFNQNNVMFTEEEKKKLESLVNSANRKRARMLKEEWNLPLFVSGQNSGYTLGNSTGLMGKESDFILAPKTKSLHRFKTKIDYIKYVANLEKVVNRDYIPIRVDRYKANYIKAVNNVFGSEGKDIVKKIEQMNRKDYMQSVQSDENLEINYVYTFEQRAQKLQQIKDSFKIK